MSLSFLAAVAAWCAIALWIVADRALHGALTQESVLASLFVLVGGSAWSLVRNRAASGGSMSRAAQRFGIPISAALTFSVLAGVAVGVEILLRTRPDDSTALLFASLLVHVCAAAIFVISASTEAVLRGLPR